MTDATVVVSYDDDELAEVDREALERALRTAMKDKEIAGQLQAKLDDDGWVEAAAFAAYSLQCDRLELRPWECTPCHAYEADGTCVDRKAGDLADKLIAADLSVWEPDPTAALRKARRRQTRCEADDEQRRRPNAAPARA
jgi:hypothetical protein